MLKDPAHLAQTPYELLGLPFEPSRDDVHRALPNFMRDRRNIARLGQASDAVKKLQSPKARAAIDIWFYHVADPGEAVTERTPPRLDEYRRVAALAPDTLYSDLDAPDPSAFFREIEPAAIRLTDVPSLDGLDAVGLRPDFDR